MRVHNMWDMYDYHKQPLSGRGRQLAFGLIPRESGDFPALVPHLIIATYTSLLTMLLLVSFRLSVCFPCPKVAPTRCGGATELPGLRPDAKLLSRGWTYTARIGHFRCINAYLAYLSCDARHNL